MILALDLGTSTGWASLCDGNMRSGSWELASTRELKESDKRCCDPRVENLHKRVAALPVKTIFFEDVLFSSSTYQTQLWSSLRGVIMLLCKRIQVRAIPVGTLKKFGSGNGNATKELMAAALLAKEPGIFSPRLTKDPKWVMLHKGNEFVTDDEVDARHLLWLARKELKV